MTQVPMAALLELAATHSGFDVDLAAPAGWMGFGSTHAPLRVCLHAGDAGLVMALSMRSVLDALDTEALGRPVTTTLPAGAVGARVVDDRPALQRALRRAWQLSRTLPNELLHAFERRTRALPRSTEAERLVVQRVGQDLFREGLLDYWEGRCAVTGLGVRELLRASHIKPWAECETDAERLDVFNGFLLEARIDAVFDQGFVTVADDGRVVVAAELGTDARELLGLNEERRVVWLDQQHRAYLAWHRTRVFRGG